MWNFEQGDSTLWASSTVQAAARPSNWFTWRNSCHSTISLAVHEDTSEHITATEVPTNLQVTSNNQEKKISWFRGHLMPIWK